MGSFDGDKSHATVLSPEVFCFLLDIAAGTTLRFQLMPDVISETKNANYTEVPIVGRSLPLLGYASSSSRQIGLDLTFVALNKPGSGKYTVDWVREQVRWLEAKVYPRYLDGFTFPPPRLQLIIGNVIGMQCVMLSCTTTWAGPWDAKDDIAKPFRASVQIQLQEFGKNDSDFGHPHSHAEAIKGENQALMGGDRNGATPIIEIPLGI